MPRPDRSPTVVPLQRDDDVPDHGLVERVLRGDRFAKDVLLRRHLPAVARTIARLLGDPIEAEDVVQDTMAAALADLASLRRPDAFRAWILRVAVNEVHRRFRRRKLLRLLGIGGEPEGGLADLASEEATQDQHAELVLLDRILATLSANERIAWSLRCVEGMSLDEVAAACGCSLATAKRRILAADQVIREHVALDLPKGAKR